jgi:chromosome segregation ATPase
MLLRRQLKATQEDRSRVMQQTLLERAQLTAQVEELSSQCSTSEHKVAALQVVQGTLQARLQQAKEAIVQQAHQNQELQQEVQAATSKVREAKAGFARAFCHRIRVGRAACMSTCMSISRRMLGCWSNKELGLEQRGPLPLPRPSGLEHV